MTRRGILLFAFIVAFASFTACAKPESPKEPEVSGQVVDGLRQIILPMGSEAPSLIVYRGDYVSFQTEGSTRRSFQVEALNIDEALPLKGEKPYIKFKEAGEFEYLLAGQRGRIVVKELEGNNYTELRSAQAKELIETVQPYILDVRTAREFAQGHIEGANLLPISEFQHRVNELAPHKEEPIFIYCRSGNRSTVAAKILLDQGFERVYNLRYGIIEWAGEGLPVQK
ncbi:rhodanese-like domain-containing protein [bacterium]|nr:rhodanese-like domain-containing protein [bacterium]